MHKVTVLSGKKLEKKQREIERRLTQSELHDFLRARGCSSTRSLIVNEEFKYSPDTYDGDANWNRLIDQRRPEVGMALCDLLLMMRGMARASDKRALKGEVRLWTWPYRIVFWRPVLEMFIECICLDAHNFGADLERGIEKIRMTYGPRVLNNIKINVSIMEPPAYVSPRRQLEAAG